MWGVCHTPIIACMSVQSNSASESPSKNATKPSPAIAPGSESLDPRRIAAEIGRRGADPRLLRLVPGFDAPFFQAGLAGYSDAAMRIIARRHGCPLCVTEALLDRTLLAGGRGFVKADLGELHDNVPGGTEDHPLACQIMGSDPTEMAAAALKVFEQGSRGDRFYRKMAYPVDGLLPTTHVAERPHLRLPGGEQLGRFDPTEGLADPAGCQEESCEDEIDATEHFSQPDRPDDAARTQRVASPVDGSFGTPFEVIDVNLACPVKKIKSKARGGHWLTEPVGAIELLRAVREALPPSAICTVKMRRSYDDTPEMASNFERIFDAAYAMGYSWATVHARTVEQKYVGPSRWTFLRDLVQRHPGKIIFGSGDVWDVNDIFRMIGYTGVAAVSVARGCIGNPWIFRQARQMMAGEPPSAPTVGEQREVLRQHFQLSLAVTRNFRDGEEHTSKLMRKFAIRFSTHHPQAEEVRQRMIAVGSTAEWMSVLDQYYGEGAPTAPPPR